MRGRTAAEFCWARWIGVLVAIGLSVVMLEPGKLQGQGTNGDAPRKVRVAAKPEYSALAKRLNLSGLVKVEVVIEADGKVKKAHVVGGHPVLALEAEKAALATEFESGLHESTQVLEFRFGAGN